MQRSHPLVRALALTAVAAVAATCADVPTPTSPLSASFVRVEIDAPASVAPGRSVQLRARAHMSDGTSRDVTTEVAWSTASDAPFSLSRSGVATGHRFGESSLEARIRPWQPVQRRLIVVPDGTFRLSGSVAVAGRPSERLAAQISVAVPGLPTSLTAVTDWWGEFVFYGVPPDASVTATAEGYLPQAQAVQLLDHDTWLDFGLRPNDEPKPASVSY